MWSGKRYYSVLWVPLKTEGHPLLAKMYGLQERLRGRKLKEIVDEFLIQHGPISKHFYSGIGTRLQNLDSKIAESVMLELLEWDIFALPVHDSFICCQMDWARVLQAMRNAFMLHVGGYLPQIKPKEWLTAKETVELVDQFGIVL
jgi:hypothetical protein